LCVLHSGEHARSLDYEVEVSDPEKEITTIIRKGIEYKANTKNGDCGSPIIVDNNAVTRKIMGIHNVGLSDSKCLGESITQRDLERTLSKIPGVLQIALDDDLIPDAELIPTELPQGILFDVFDYFKKWLPCRKFFPVAQCTKSLNVATRSAIKPSLVHGYVPPISKPAYLKNIVVNGEEVDIRKKNLSKAAMDTPYISKNLVKEAAIGVKRKLLRNPKESLKKVFTLEEAVEGIKGEDYVLPINRRTSPGIPWVHEKKNGYVGKSQWLGSEEDYKITEDLRRICEERIDFAKQGNRYPTIFTDTLKDERRPIAKVNEGKTRVFAAGPMDFTLVFRMYFLGFIAHCMENRITNEQ
jgi:hypothetical protein